MKKFTVSLLTLCVSSSLYAGVPFFNASCPTNIDVHAEKGGYVFINGNTAELKKYNENAYDINYKDITVSISINPDGTLADPMYSRANGANGVCQLKHYEGEEVDTGSNCKSKEMQSNTYHEPVGKVVEKENMEAFCRGEVSAKYNTKPMYVKTGKVVHLGALGYFVSGDADLGNKGMKKFQCQFDGHKKFLLIKN